MRRSATTGLAVLLTALLMGAAPAAAAMAAITTVAPVAEDASEEGLKAAAASALGRAMRGAQAMGFDDVMVKSIQVVPGTGVVVELMAADSDASPESEVESSGFRPAPPAKPTL
jgi:hypothetical protein